MKKFVQRIVVVMVAAAVFAPTLAAGAPHYPKKDRPIMRQHKAERTAKKKAKAMEVKTSLWARLHGN